MKKLICLMIVTISVLSCTATKDVQVSRQDQRKARKLEEQMLIRKAVESRQYILKFDKLYLPGGGFANLVARNNYLIIDGEIASVSLGYIGPSYFIRRITGINSNGHTVNYSMKSDETKGTYRINLKVKQNNDSFDFYIDISANGSCRLSVINPRIQSVSYSGNVVPVRRVASEVKDKPTVF
jgi:hypothetical protein